MKHPSALEETLAFQIKAMKLPEPVREFKFHPKRQWRLDFAWPGCKIAVEVEGGAWTGGRHLRGYGFQADCEKYAMALIAGWRVLRVTGQMVKDGTALDYIEQILKGNGNEHNESARKTQ